MPSTPPDRITVMVVEDNPMYRNIVQKSLSHGPEDIEVIAIANNALTAIQMISTIQPDVAIVDLQLPQFQGDMPENGKAKYGVDTIRVIRYLSPKTKVLVISQFSPRMSPNIVMAALAAGAHGYIPKNDLLDEKVLNAVNSMVRGNESLVGRDVAVLVREYLGTDRMTAGEKQIVDLLVKGRSPDDISESLDMSVTEVIRRIQAILVKCHNETRLSPSWYVKEMNDAEMDELL